MSGGDAMKQIIKIILPIILIIAIIAMLIPSAIPARASIGSYAVDDTYTKALLHFNGADASTTFTDESGKTWTAEGSAQIDTDQKRLGNASGIFGAGSIISSPNNADFDFGSDNFTIDFCVMYSTKANQANLIEKRSGYTVVTPFLITSSNTTLTAKISMGVTWDVIISGEHNYSDNTWHHIALVRSGNDFKLFSDGTQLGDTSTVSGSLMTNTDNITVGGSANGYYLYGWIDELRISKGIARWTANFTPPTAEYAEAATNTPTETSTFTLTPSNTPTFTLTPSETATFTLTPSETATFTLTPSNTPTFTLTPSDTSIYSPTPSDTPSLTFTPSLTYTPSATLEGAQAITATYEAAYIKYKSIAEENMPGTIMLAILCGILLLAGIVIFSVWIIRRRR
jgi:hypothetical protein